MGATYINGSTDKLDSQNIKEQNSCVKTVFIFTSVHQILPSSTHSSVPLAIYLHILSYVGDPWYSQTFDGGLKHTAYCTAVILISGFVKELPSYGYWSPVALLQISMNWPATQQTASCGFCLLIHTTNAIKLTEWLLWLVINKCLEK